MFPIQTRVYPAPRDTRSRERSRVSLCASIRLTLPLVVANKLRRNSARMRVEGGNELTRLIRQYRAKVALLSLSLSQSPLPLLLRSSSFVVILFPRLLPSFSVSSRLLRCFPFASFSSPLTIPVSIFRGAFSEASPICTWLRDDDGADCEDSHLLIALAKLADCLAGPLDESSAEPLVPSLLSSRATFPRGLASGTIFHVDVAYTLAHTSCGSP